MRPRPAGAGLDEARVKTIDTAYRRSLGDELAYVCGRLQADEAEILGKALRRGLLEIYKAVVLHDLESGRLDRKEASRLLGSRVVDRSIAGLGHRRPRRSRSSGPRRRRRRSRR
jgi:hypothetical protein